MLAMAETQETHGWPPVDCVLRPAAEMQSLSPNLLRYRMLYCEEHSLPIDSTCDHRLTCSAPTPSWGGECSAGSWWREPYHFSSTVISAWLRWQMEAYRRKASGWRPRQARRTSNGMDWQQVSFCYMVQLPRCSKYLPTYVVGT